MAAQTPSTFLNIEQEVRLQILGHVVALEDDRTVALQPHALPEGAWQRLKLAMTDPCDHNMYKLPNNIFPVQRVAHKPQSQILRVCRQLRGEAMDLFYKVNGFVTICVNDWQTRALMWHFPRLQPWNKLNSPFEPVIQIMLCYSADSSQRTFVIPAVDLSTLAPALHMLEGGSAGPWPKGKL